MIKIKNKSILSIPVLFRMILRYIYEPENMSIVEEKEMMSSFNSWKNAIDIEKEKLSVFREGDLKLFGKLDDKISPTTHKYFEEEYHLKMMAEMLWANEAGEYDPRKINFKEKGIDYRKYHRIPEAFTPQDFENGRKAGEEHEKLFPEFYGENLT